MSTVSLELNGNIAIITIDNPPVNAISQNVRQGIVDNIKLAENTDKIDAIIIHCAGRTFMAGADIKEFGKPPLEPHLPNVVNVIEQCSKPVVAAIHGHALGGGFEIALGAHYRIAHKDAKVGLPEVNLGLLPGAGGTQRLPRLIGAEAALDIMTSGQPINAQKAQKLGILDAVSNTELLSDAINFIRSKAIISIENKRLSNLRVPPVAADFFNEKRQELAKKRKGFEAPQAIVNAVEFATTLSFENGIQQERKLFEQCRASTQSVALRHMFFAERTSLKVDDIDKSVVARDVKKVAIIGAGTMGGGIAMCFADAGFDVTLLEINPDALAAGLARIEKTYDASVKKGRIDTATRETRINSIKGTTSYNDLSDVDLVIEAAFEKIEVKEIIFKELDRVTKKGCILASNTSYLDVNTIANFTNRPEDVLGLHFFSPANIMKLLEIVRCDKTAKDVVQTALMLTKKIGKIGVVSGVCHGFIGNRMYQGYQREAGLLLLEGATPSQIDKAMTDFGMPMGPCAVGDLSGLDIGYFMRQTLDESQYEVKAFKVHSKLVEMDRKGQKTGAGFYTYPNGARQGSPDPMVEQLIIDTAEELKITRREISNNEIVERCIYAVVNEGANILAEGIAQRASDIDVVFCNGYGFPRWRGGPMKYAQTIGYSNVIKAMDTFAKIAGPRWWTASSWLKENS
tara:strand:+ start:30492 stop:32546 length:2055 start_codon:yes stop_codon:yes gene_type:complete